MAHNTMGAVFRAKDLPAGWRKRVQESIKDLSPDTKDSWEDTKSEQKLKEMLGHDKAESLMKNIRTISKSTLTYEQQKQVKDMFRDSLTFD
jgi:hypothetical protein